MSGGSNQRTLFQTWGVCTSQNKPVQPARGGQRTAEASSSNNSQGASTHPRISPWAVIGQDSSYASEKQADILADEEDDDDLMVVAVSEAEKNLQLENPSCFQDHSVSSNPAFSPTPSCGRIYPDFPGFDSSSANVWIYPTNYPIREYQLKMSEVALFQNTLVCLPTGLGKTFIASVVMYNFYRWYPSGKIVFMAPTKPLVAQQIEACYKVMGIPQAHMAELTGNKTIQSTTLKLSMVGVVTVALVHWLFYRQHSSKAETRVVEVQAGLLPHPSGPGERSVQRHVSSQAG